ncbi:alkaline phosphatase PhoX [Myxococcus stipitatus]|uniref:alkaline phosphatase PhoX n=1 Tax=Myxococcus stipitatus TaxID=83455 RepID=UPI0030CEE2CE
MRLRRRDFVRLSALGGGAIAFGPAFWRQACAAPAEPGPSPYGPISSRPDAHGVRLPPGFTSRIIARSGEAVGGTGYTWHAAPDGGACFECPGGGWIYVSNCEWHPGGASAVVFDAGGGIESAYRILSGTEMNCAGGPTPWGTWLSCEERPQGRVWECDPSRPSQGVVCGELGTFAHEAVAVDPDGGHLYLTEDQPNGRLYRFTPTQWTRLSEGVLEAASVTGDAMRGLATVRWVPCAKNLPASRQPSVASRTTVFNGGEGCWYDSGVVYLTTKGDNRVWAYTPSSGRLEVIYAAAMFPGSPLSGGDNAVVSRSGDLFVAEDGRNRDICLITPPPHRVVSTFLRVHGHAGSELTGPAFSPDGQRLYFSSQRGLTNSPYAGVTFEVSGPFR